MTWVMEHQMANSMYTEADVLSTIFVPQSVHLLTRQIVLCDAVGYNVIYIKPRNGD